MKIAGSLIKRSINEEGKTELTFVVDGYYDTKVANELEKKKFYLDISEWHSKRSIQQNSYLWALINEIAKQTGADDWDIYCELLQRAGAKYEYIQAPAKAQNILAETFRAIKKLMVATNGKGNEIATFKCYYGSSKMNSKEMAELLDITIDLAYQLGIDAEGVKNESMVSFNA